MLDPFDMRKFGKEMNKLFDPFCECFGTDCTGHKHHKGHGGFMRRPLSDMKETENEIIALFEIPGVNKKDIIVNVTDEYIEVKAEKKRAEIKEGEDHFRASRMYKGFYKSVMLPVEVVPEKTKASYKDGILEVTMTKAEKEKKKEAKKVDIV